MSFFHFKSSFVKYFLCLAHIYFSLELGTYAFLDDFFKSKNFGDKRAAIYHYRNAKQTKEKIKKYNINFKVTKIKLLCFPRIFGYVFNPLSIFYCYNENNELRAILYEVKNTFNEQHTYIFPVQKNEKIITQTCNKKFYVSPFMEMETAYNFRLAEPKETLSIFIKQTDDKGMLLSACQIGKKEQISTKKLVQNFFKHPMMTIKIIMAIHFEALRLWKKGVKLVKKNSKIKNNLSVEK